MGKDLPGKNLLNCTDVFADISNVNLFEGEELLHEEELEQMPTEVIYKDNYGMGRKNFRICCRYQTHGKKGWDP